MSSEYKKIYSLLELISDKLNFNDGVLSGNLIADQELLRNLSYLSQYSDFVQIDIKRSQPPNLIDKISINESFDVSITLTRSNGHFFGLDLADLLSSQGGKYCRETPAKSVYLINEPWKSWEPENSEYKQSVPMTAYYKTINFISFLKSDVANHSKDESLHFFGNDENLVLEIKYDASSIKDNAKAILDSLTQINSIIDSDMYSSDKCKQLKYVIIDQLKTFPKKDRFNILIKNISDIAHRFHHNYELFISGFSFEDNKEKLKKENREYTDKLNSVINSVHSRIISIPVGTVVPALLLKSEKVGSSGLEWLIFLASCFLFIVIAVSLHNQYILLNKIRSEYKEKWKRMKSEISNLIDSLEDEYKDLESSYKRNRFLIFIFSLFLLLFFLAPVSIYIFPQFFPTM